MPAFFCKVAGGGANWCHPLHLALRLLVCGTLSQPHGHEAHARLPPRSRAPLTLAAARCSRAAACRVVLEWDRRYLAVLGVAGRRLYEFRLQTSNSAYEADADRLLTIATSFRCRDV